MGAAAGRLEALRQKVEPPLWKIIGRGGIVALETPGKGKTRRSVAVEEEFKTDPGLV